MSLYVYIYVIISTVLLYFFLGDGLQF